MPTRAEPKHRMTVDRQLVLFHYEHAVKHAERPASIAAIEKQSFGNSSVELALLSSVSRKHLALYSLRRDGQTGYRFRRLHPELEGDELTEAVRGATSDDPRRLAALGLSYPEISAVTGLDPERLRKVLRKA